MDCTGRHWSLTGISWKQALETLAQINALQAETTSEETSTASVAGYNTPGAFARQGEKTNRATQQSEREGWQRIGEDDGSPQRWAEPSKTWWQGRFPIGHASASLTEGSEREQTGRKDARQYPFGEDPLGKNERHHGRTAWEPISEASGSNAVSGSISENQTLAYLADVLPADGIDVSGNMLAVNVAEAEIRVTANRMKRNSAFPSMPITRSDCRIQRIL